MELIRRWRGKPKNAPRAARWFSPAYVRAEIDLAAAERLEAMLTQSLMTNRDMPKGSVRAIVERVFDARRARIDALWRLGWDKSAKSEQRDLDERESRQR